MLSSTRSSRSRSPRERVAVVTVVALVPLAAGCGSDDDGGGSSATTVGSTSATEADTTPITVGSTSATEGGVSTTAAGTVLEEPTGELVKIGVAAAQTGVIGHGAYVTTIERLA